MTPEPSDDQAAVLPKPAAIEIWWGDAVYQFASAAEACAAGFRLPQEEKKP